MKTEQRKLLLGLAESLLQEEPIDNYSTVGDWETNHSFRDVDRRLLTSPKAVEKIKAAWNNTPYHFDIFMVNKSGMGRFAEIGEVDMEYVRFDLGLDWFEVPQNRPDAITVIYTNNQGAERVMMTGWIMAHRLGHAFYARRGNVQNGQTSRMYRNYTDYLERIAKTILDEVYNKDLRAAYGDPTRQRDRQTTLRWFANQLGTMKSAREDNLRTWEEFAHELLAQYLLTGSIEFNPLPQKLVTGYGAYGRERAVYASEPEHDWNARNTHNQSTLAYYAKQIEMTLKDVLNAATGSIFVM